MQGRSMKKIMHNVSTEAAPITLPSTLPPLTRQMVVDARDKLRQAAVKITADQIRKAFKIPPLPWLGGVPAPTMVHWLAVDADVRQVVGKITIGEAQKADFVAAWNSDRRTFRILKDRYNAYQREPIPDMDYAQAEARVMAALVPGQSDFGAGRYDVDYDSAGKARFYVLGIEQTPDEFEDAIQNDVDLDHAQVRVLQNHVDCIEGKGDPGMTGPIPRVTPDDLRKAFGGGKGTVTGRYPTQQQNVPKDNPDAKVRSTRDALKYWLTADITLGPDDPPMVTSVDLALDDGKDTPVDHGKELIRENLLDPARQKGPSDTVKRFLKAFPDD